MPSVANVTVGGKVTAAKENEQSGWINKTGMTLVTPSSVTVGSGTATIGTNGVVTFTTVGTSLSVNGLFNDSLGHKYKIVIEQTAASAANFLNIFMRDTTPTDSVTGYDSAVLYNNAPTTAATLTTTGGTTNGWNNLFALTAVIQTIVIDDLSNAGAAAESTGSIKITSAPAAAAIGTTAGSIRHRVTSAMGGFTLKPSTGTITGRITVYMYNDL